MGLQNTFLAASAAVLLFLSGQQVLAQAKPYQRKKPVAAPTAANPAASASAPTSAPAAKADSDKLDITELEQKYWAPKDTDFSVVQNRTYTKAGRAAVSLTYGFLMNDTFNDGPTVGAAFNYYFDERHGVELMYQSSDLTDSDAISDFLKLSGGATRPDFNRAVSFLGFGYNFVPFYAKMSFLGKKIIYFDMQVTPFVGQTTFEQQSKVKTPEESAFTYGFEITQYFFFTKNFAVRANYHNRYYRADVLNFTNGAVALTDRSTNEQMFLLGVTIFTDVPSWQDIKGVFRKKK